MLTRKIVLDLLGKLESKKFHKNRREKTYTTPYGVYAYYWKESSIIKYVEKIAKDNKIDLDTIAGRKKMTKLVFEDKEVKKEFGTHAYKFFIDNFTKAPINDALGEKANISFFVFAVNAGLGTAIKTMQRAIGTHADGKFGKNSLRKLSDATSKLTDEQLSQRFNDEAYKHYKRLSSWSLFGRGWANRLRAVGWSK